MNIDCLCSVAKLVIRKHCGCRGPIVEKAHREIKNQLNDPVNNTETRHRHDLMKRSD